VNDEVLTNERATLDTRHLLPEGVIKLSLGKKRHALLRAV
jgi:tyrosyl-tRNA synthetase